MLLIIFAILLLSIIGLNLLRLTVFANNVTVNERSDQTVFYFAEAGANLEKAKVLKVIQHLDSEIKTFYNNLDFEEQEKLLQPHNNNITNYYYETLRNKFCGKYLEIYKENCSSTYMLTKQFSKQPKVETKIKMEGEKIIVESLGYFEGEKSKARKVRQELKINSDLRLSSSGNNGESNPGNTTDLGPLTGYAVMTKGEIELSTYGKIVGNVGSISGTIRIANSSNGVTGKVAATSIDMVEANDYKNHVINNFQSLPEALKGNPNQLDKYLPPFPDDMFNKFNTIPLYSNIAG